MPCDQVVRLEEEVLTNQLPLAEKTPRRPFFIFLVANQLVVLKEPRGRENHSVQGRPSTILNLLMTTTTTITRARCGHKNDLDLKNMGGSKGATRGFRGPVRSDQIVELVYSIERAPRPPAAELFLAGGTRTAFFPVPSLRPHSSSLIGA